MRVAVTTTTRNTPLEVPSGWLRIFDWEAQRQVAMAPLPDAVHRARDPNPRGGFRGGRGIAFAGDRLAVGINDRILVLDHEWQLQRVISHRWMGGVHGISANEDGVWTACCDNDLVVGFDGKVVCSGPGTGAAIAACGAPSTMDGCQGSTLGPIIATR